MKTKWMCALEKLDLKIDLFKAGRCSFRRDWNTGDLINATFKMIDNGVFDTGFQKSREDSLLSNLRQGGKIQLGGFC